MESALYGEYDFYTCLDPLFYLFKVFLSFLLLLVPKSYISVKLANFEMYETWRQCYRTLKGQLLEVLFILQ